jgi:hypothetical protein
MQSSKNIQKLDAVDYSLGISNKVLFLSLGFLFLLAFFIHFPIQRQLEGLIKTQMASIPGCSMSFERLRIEFFLPKIVLTEMRIPGSCMGSTQGIKLPYINLYFRGPSFSPLGFAFKASTEIKKQSLGIYFATGIARQVIRVDEENFDLSALNKLTSLAPKLSGKSNIDALISIQGNRLDELKLSVESKDLSVPSQAMSDIKLPKLEIGDFSLKVESLDGKKVDIKEFIIGGVNSSIRGRFTGQITLSSGAIAFSPASIKGEANFSEELIQSFPILNLMLPQFTQQNNFYQIQLSGTLNNLRPVAGP